MKPPLFHVGQAVVCVSLPNEIDREPGTFLILKKGAVYTVNWIQYIRSEGGWYIGCEEWPSNECCLEVDFAPAELLPDAALAELLEETLAPVTA